MLTYTADSLLSLCHSRPPSRAVHKAIFSARAWQLRAARSSADRPNVNKHVNQKPADCDRRLRVGWLNVRSLANKSTAVQETIVTQNLDVLVLTETWHHNSRDVKQRCRFRSGSPTAHWSYDPIVLTLTLTLTLTLSLTQSRN